MPETVFDVVAEDPQIEHVARHVDGIERMHEHRGEDRHQRTGKVVDAHARAAEAAWRRAELEHERPHGAGVADVAGAGAGAERDLVEIDQRVEDDEDDGHHGHRSTRDVVAQRDHRTASAGRSTTTVGRAR